MSAKIKDLSLLKAATFEKLLAKASPDRRAALVKLRDKQRRERREAASLAKRRARERRDARMTTQLTLACLRVCGHVAGGSAAQHVDVVGLSPVSVYQRYVNAAWAAGMTLSRRVTGDGFLFACEASTHRNSDERRAVMLLDVDDSVTLGVDPSLIVRQHEQYFGRAFEVERDASSGRWRVTRSY